MPTLKELADPINMLEWLGVSSMGFPEPFTFGLRAYRFLKGKIHNYDVIHDNQSLSYGIWAINRLRPTVATIHHPITVDRRIAVRSEASPWKKLKQWRWYSFIGMQKRVARRLSHFITVSKAAQKDISRDFKISAARFRIVPNGIDTDVFYPVSGVEQEKNRIIVTNSADTPLKGLNYLLRAVAEISANRPIRLVVVGQPKKNGMIRSLISQLGIEKSVQFTGRIDNQEYVYEYAKASMAVVPSVYEGFGLPAGEAMACGVPVISTTGGALPEVVGDVGILVPPADSGALTKAITTLLDNPAHANRLGRQGFKRVHENFTWEKAAEKTAAAYREAIRDHRRVQSV
jgi:glycosyltransferase involved in cell wall biosynthesis